MPRIVDVHAHFYPKPFIEILRKSVATDRLAWGRHNALVLERAIGVRPEMWDIDRHIDVMDRAGVEVQALSLSHPQSYFNEEDVAVEAARVTNDTMAEVCARYPTRFKGLASLPMPHAEASMKELDRAINTLGLHGVAFGTTARYVHLDDERFLPIYREINRMKLAIFLHPMTPIGYEEMTDYNLLNSAGFLMETALAVLRLCNRGVFEENPDLNFIVPHLGTYLLSAFERVGGSNTAPPMDVEPGAKTRTASKPPREYLPKLYYDSVNPHMPFWKCAIDTVGADHIVFGTDFPFGSADGMMAMVKRIENLDVSEADREAIFHTTADRILR